MVKLGRNLSTLALVAGLAVALPVQAAQVYATSYSGRNGGDLGYGYMDDSYSGSGVGVSEGPLSGGLGDLTDGIIASASWTVVEAPVGPGPNVGWRSSQLLTSAMTFNFNPGTTITSIRLYLDDSRTGGVVAPDQIWIDGVLSAYTQPVLADPTLVVDLLGYNLTGLSHTIRFTNSSQWTFASEISFFGGIVSGGVPEPATWAMMLVGFGLMGTALRRRSATRLATTA